LDKTTQLSHSLEDYIETIYLLQTRDQTVRAKDIADQLEVRRASVTGALRILGDKGLVNYTPYKHITLTQQGEVAAKEILQRHNIIKRFLTEILDFDADVADPEACKMEHTLSKPVRDRLRDFMTFIDACPRTGANWLKGFHHYLETQNLRQDCERCLRECTDHVEEPLDD
jgi:DtxR family Mn-dependent transcriptional regulator